MVQVVASNGDRVNFEDLYPQAVGRNASGQIVTITGTYVNTGESWTQTATYTNGVMSSLSAPVKQ